MDKNIGMFVGRPSGGNQQGINGGDYFFFYLPYSGMEVDIPLKYFAPPTSKPDSGIIPDVIIRESQKQIYEGKDSVMAFVLNHC